MRGVSIIIPCYNAGRFIEETVGSIQAEIPYEIIIVDDCSPDAQTHAVLDRIANSDPRVHLHKFSSNQGQSAARNKAIELATYDIISPLDADDRIRALPGKSYFDRAFDTLTNNPNVVLAYSPCREFGPGSVNYVAAPYDPKLQLIHNRLSYFASYRRDEAFAAGGYNEKLRFAEDWDFWTALLNRRFMDCEYLDAVRFSEPYLDYRKHDTNENASAAPKRVPLLDTLTAMMNRSPEIYDYYYRGHTPETLTALAEKRADSKLARAYDLAMADPSLLLQATSRYAMNNLRRLFGGSSGGSGSNGSTMPAGQMPQP